MPRTLDEARARDGARTVRLSGGVTAYHVHGERGPWVVLVHGILTPMYAWEPLARALAAAGFRVLRYDQFGRGLSDRPKLDYRLEVYTRQLRELLSALEIDAAHVVAWSFGGVIASRFALDNPAIVDRLALIAPGLFLEKPRDVAFVSRLPFAKWIIAARTRPKMATLPAEHLAHPERFPHYLERMREQLRVPRVARSFASSVMSYPWQYGPELRAVGEHPRRVLVVWGDGDKVTPYANAVRVQELYPRAELLTIAGAKHAPHIEHEAEVNAAIGHFLARDADATRAAGVAP